MSATSAVPAKVQVSSTGLVSHQSGAESSSVTPVPILKVMRLQAPDLSSPSSGSLGTPALPSPALSLPDSFGVIHIGETFTAYLGILNPSPNQSISHVSVVAQLQTPTRRITLPSRLENISNNITVLDPLQDINAIVSRSLEEVGQHILRVEVLYAANSRTLRKFYRFQVASPLHIRELTVRGGDSSCFVSISIENATETTALVVSCVEFAPPEGLEADKITTSGGETCFFKSTDYKMLPQHQQGAALLGEDSLTDEKSLITTEINNYNNNNKSAVELFDCCGRLPPGSSYRYIFHIRAVSLDAQTRGITAGDILGKAIFTWYKTMGEAGRIASTDIVCPPSYPSSLLTLPDGVSNNYNDNNNMSRFIMYKSGLSVDVAASAENKSARYVSDSSTSTNKVVTLDEVFPVTVDPIDPPCTMTLGTSHSIAFCIINHSDAPLNLQLQFRLSNMYGIVVSGKSFINLGEVSGFGGSALAQVQMLPLMAGLCQLLGCFVVDLSSGKEIPMPPLFNVFVEPKQLMEDEKKEG